MTEKMLDVFSAGTMAFENPSDESRFKFLSELLFGAGSSFPLSIEQAKVAFKEYEELYRVGKFVPQEVIIT